VPLLVDLVEELRAYLLSLVGGCGLLVEVEALLGERVAASVDPDLEAVPMGTDAASLTTPGLRVRHDCGTYSWPMPWPQRTARLPGTDKRAGQTLYPRQDLNL
jgi:hypothetical protein